MDQGVKGCYVCGRDHRASTRHSRSGVQEVIRRFKQRNLKAMITVEDLAFIPGDLCSENENDDEDNTKADGT